MERAGVIMNKITLKKEEAAFYFNLALLNLQSFHKNILDNEQRNELLNNSEVLKKVENYIFNFKDTAKNIKGEIDVLILKLQRLRNYYSHYVHKDDVKILRDNEKTIIGQYYEIAKEKTSSEASSLEIFEGNRLKEAGVLFFLCMFLKKSQANNLIGSISGLKRTDTFGRPRRKLFTYYSIREGYKIVPDMKKHFLMFSIVNYLINQDENLELDNEYEPSEKSSIFQRTAATFLNISEILKDMKFYTYKTERLKEKQGKIKQDEGRFTWTEPFDGNNYFQINDLKGVMNEKQLKELCYALLIEKKNIDFVEGKVKQFLKQYQSIERENQLDGNTIIDRKYFPANYFGQDETQDIKREIIYRIEKKIEAFSQEPKKSYEKMREIMTFINNRLPSEEKLKKKDYKRYLKMVRFWKEERNNIKLEFGQKQWLKSFTDAFWLKGNLEEAYIYARKENKQLLEEQKERIENLSEQTFEKLRKVINTDSIGELKKLTVELRIEWKEKDWDEYSRQTKSKITETRKFSIMKQSVIKDLKKKYGIENIKLRIGAERDKSRKAVLNRIAVPKHFIEKHILQTEEKIPKKIRESNCQILLSKKYNKLSKEYYKKKDLKKMTAINDLYEKNILIAFMVSYLMGTKEVDISLAGQKSINELKKTKVKYKISNKTEVEITFKQYPSLTHAINSSYIDNVDGYEFPDEDKKKDVFKKIEIIEYERKEFIRKVLEFEENLCKKEVISRKRVADAIYISFNDICEDLKAKDWNEDKLNKIKNYRNNALHGKILDKNSYRNGKLLIEKMMEGMA